MEEETIALEELSNGENVNSGDLIAMDEGVEPQQQGQPQQQQGVKRAREDGALDLAETTNDQEVLDFEGASSTTALPSDAKRPRIAAGDLEVRHFFFNLFILMSRPPPL
jgi:hypothetical protein